MLEEVEAFNKRWGQGIPSFRGQADMLTDARTLRCHATEAAMAASEKDDRIFLLGVRRLAGQHERRLRRSLTVGDGS